ncbi:Precorrin-6A reductase [Halomonadaceae bacterium LMG 33818]|uniref:cobalt-precorrin-6A reductase n=1 Tax=Cernens ardua TaxID=3402176 RepID=UPI003EDC30E1
MKNGRHILILGGTAESRALTEQLADCPELEIEVSLAGRTQTSRSQKPSNSSKPSRKTVSCKVNETSAKAQVSVRTGGFGGVEGLARYLTTQEIDALVVATHPFAAQIARNAFEAAKEVGIPALRVERPAWSPQREDHWVHARNMEEAARSLGATPSNVFLTIGRQQLEPFEQLDRQLSLQYGKSQHHYLVRSIEPITPPPALMHVTWLQARGPFSKTDELALMQRYHIDTLVTKNSGSPQVYAKLEAARTLGVKVVMVERPELPDFVCASSVEEAVEWILRGR